jgi:hypothetical protein
MDQRTRDSIPGLQFVPAVIPQTRDWQRKTFGPFGKRVLLALAEAFFTDSNDPADRGAAQRFIWLVDDVDDFISQASPALRWGTRVAALLVEFAPIFFIGRFARCSSLGLEDRERYLATLEASKVPRVAVLVVMFKTVMTVLYFEHPEAAPHLGYDGRHERFRASRASLPVVRRSE